MPQDLVVRESRGLHIVLALFSVGLLTLLLPSVFNALTDGVIAGKDILLLAFTAMFVCGLPLFLKAAWQRKVVLVAFKKGLFFPKIHPEVIPWDCVQSVRVSRIGSGTSVLFVLSDAFEKEMPLPWLVRVLAWIGQRIGLRGWLFSGLHSHSKPAIVHAVDDWIRYETRQAPKPRYRPGVIDKLLRFLGGSC